MDPLDLVHLSPLMKLSSGRPEVLIGLIDGPVLTHHPGLDRDRIRHVGGQDQLDCSVPASIACEHGTFVAGILIGKEESHSPAICRGCTLLVSPIFREGDATTFDLPQSTPAQLADSIVRCVLAGARILNLSVGLTHSSITGDRCLEDALDYASDRGVITVAAAGNQNILGSSVITRHPWVIPTVACDLQGWPLAGSNLGASIGKRGLTAPGAQLISLGTCGRSTIGGGTSFAAPFVTGAVALLWSLFPRAAAAAIRSAVTCGSSARRSSIVPPILNAWGAYKTMQANC